MITSRVLTRLVHRPVLLKLENFQMSGSCKDRGVSSFCRKAAGAGAQSFIVSPGGNAALAVARAGNFLNVPVHAILPVNASPLLLQHLVDAGAVCTQHGETWAHTENFARDQAKVEGGVYIPSYDHPEVWEGNSTVIDEIAAMGIRPGVIVLAVGGGGLLCGVIEGLRRAGWVDTPIIAAELKSTASLHASMKMLGLVELPHCHRLHPSIVGPSRITQHALHEALAHRVITHVVDELDAVSACRRFADDHQMKIEPMTGAVLSTIYQGAALLAQYDSVLAIIGGGNRVVLEELEDLPQLRQASQHLPSQ